MVQFICRCYEMAEGCQHNYCPHLHFKKCRKERERHIPYTYRPTKEIEVSCNAHPKMLNLSISNIPTLAYEQYSIAKAVPAQDEMNFSKNFYLENCPDQFQLRNNLVQDMESSMSEQSAYVLALGATKQYDAFSKRRSDHLANAQRRAKISYQNYFQQKREEMLSLKEEQRKWVTDYFRKVEELIDHIYGRHNQNVDPNLQDKLFIRENQGKSSKYLAGVKVSNPTVALDILQSLRALLLRKKLALDEARKDQEHNKSVSASCIDSSASQDVTQGSFMSAATNDLTQEPGEQHFAEQFCDFQSLEKRWGIKDVGQIRNVIRRLLAKKLIINAEGRQMRERKAAKEKNALLKKQMAEMGHSMPQSSPKGKGKGKGKDAKTVSKAKEGSKSKQIQKNAKQTPIEMVPMFKDSLNSEQQQVKTTILKGGQFDTVGDKYQRNRNYSLLFKKRKQQSQFQLSFHQEKNQFFRPNTARK